MPAGVLNKQQWHAHRACMSCIPCHNHLTAVSNQQCVTCLLYLCAGGLLPTNVSCTASHCTEAANPYAIAAVSGLQQNETPQSLSTVNIVLPPEPAESLQLPLVFLLLMCSGIDAAATMQQTCLVMSAEVKLFSQQLQLPAHEHGSKQQQ